VWKETALPLVPTQISILLLLYAFFPAKADRVDVELDAGSQKTYVIIAIAGSKVSSEFDSSPGI
jgi:uncharacterized membrane protein